MTDTPTTPSPERQPADAGGGLLPCPFCDTTCHVVAWPREFRGRMVAMIECFTDNCYALITADTPADAIAAWNRRAPAPQAQPDARAVEGLIRDCAKQFRFYEKSHAAKGTPDGDAKAIVNAQFAQRCEDALSAPAADDGWRPSREEVARVIDSEAVDADLDEIGRGFAGAVKKTAMAERAKSALAKADAILALHPAAPTDEVGKS